MRVHQILAALAKLEPRSRATLPLKIAGDCALMKILKTRGLRAAERLVAGLNARGHGFQLAEKAPGRRYWREQLAGGRRVFELRVARNRVYQSAALRYLAIRGLHLTPSQLRAQALQKLFYDRSMEIGQRAYRDPTARLAPLERRLLLVGELEADVNNGGFSQYLDNKGRRRARATLTALKAIGARKTAAMLAKAMKPGVAEAELSALDAAFYRGPEDLAVLAAKHLKLTAPALSRARGGQ